LETSTAFQDMFLHNFCYGCGTDNPKGLQIKSFWENGESVCRFQGQSHHSAGPRNVLNGGIIATIIDCHCVCTATAHACREEGIEIGEDPTMWFVTGSLHVDYLKPAPLSTPVELRARVTKAVGRKITVTCDLFDEGELCAKGEVLAVRVPSEWNDKQGL